MQTLTPSIERLYAGINTSVCISTLVKFAIVHLRSDGILQARNKIYNTADSIYKNAVNFVKNKNNIPEQILTILGGLLGFMKSYHIYPDTIMNSPVLDRICAERNLLFFCPYLEASLLFSPYIIDLNNLTATMCQLDGQFEYPPTL